MKFTSWLFAGVMLLVPLRSFAACTSNFESIKQVVQFSLSRTIKVGSVWDGKVKGQNIISIKFVQPDNGAVMVELTVPGLVGNSTYGPMSATVCDFDSSITIEASGKKITISGDASSLTATGFSKDYPQVAVIPQKDSANANR